MLSEKAREAKMSPLWRARPFGVKLLPETPAIAEVQLLRPIGPCVEQMLSEGAVQDLWRAASRGKVSPLSDASSRRRCVARILDCFNHRVNGNPLCESKAIAHIRGQQSEDQTWGSREEVGKRKRF